MLLNKALKNLLLAVPVLAVVACSSHKNNNDAQDLFDVDGTDTVDGNLNGLNNSDANAESVSLQMQQLQQNNIIYFGLDKYDILPEFAQVLDQHAAFLRSNPSYKVTIEGHADERGTPEYNISLGERRANSVKMYLQGRGVGEDQMSIVSYGKEKPAVLGHDEAAWSKNRRAVLVY
jgi:peptidoglycan-associated lipoprotein